MTLGTQKVRKNAQFWSEHFLLRTASAALAADAGSQDLEAVFFICFFLHVVLQR